MINKIVVIGCGNVGTSYIYAILNQKTKVEELVLIDINEDKAIGEVMDLNHSLAFTKAKIKIKVGKYQDVENAKIVVITAGINQKVGETRLNLKNKNQKIVEDITKKVMQNNFKGIFLIATNPVDIMSKIVYKTANTEANKVIGSGTCLDTARLRYLIGKELNINSKNIHAYVIGEHGDSSFVPYEYATVGLIPIKNYLNENKLNEIALDVKNSAYKIIEKKGFTNFGIGACLVEITNSILEDNNSILTISCYNEKNDIFISQLAIINKDGVKKILDLNLNKKDQELFTNSINVLKNE